MELTSFLTKDTFDIQKYVISNIKDLINTKKLIKGDKLPSEKILSERLEVPIDSIRAALKKLETFCVLKQVAKTKIYAINMDNVAVNGILENLLNLESTNFRSLLEARLFLGLKTASLAAQNRTDKDLEHINITFQKFKNKALKIENTIQEDLLFHLAIVKASSNVSLHSLMLMLVPQLITNLKKHEINYKDFSLKCIRQYQIIIDAIKNKNSILAEEKMKEHFKCFYENFANKEIDF